MQREPDCVVDDLPLAEGLMPALVGDHPDPGAYSSLEEPVCWPQQTIR